MATPFSADKFVAILRAEGCRVVTVDQWRTHNRNHRGPWGPINGVMIHHTAGHEKGAVSFCYNVDADLPGPLCQGVITKDGTVHVISVGRSNHAGGGDPNVLAAVKDERYYERPPVPRVGNKTGIDGNAHFYGFECVNLGDGKDPWPDAQVDAIIRSSAAICRAYGWSEKSTIGHAEWSSDKRDPRGPGDVVSMPRLRAKIKERLAHPASWNPSTPAPTNPQGPNVTLPLRSVLSRTENLTLVQDVPQTLYWTTEYQEDGNQHGEGGKTVGTNIRFDGLVNLRFTGLPQGENVEVYVAEEDGNGVLMGESPVRSQTWGQHEGFHPVAQSHPLNGTVAGRMVVRVVSRAEQPVTLEEAWLHLWSYPNS